jgi:hypothetical protein
MGVSKTVDTACIHRDGDRYRIEFGADFLATHLQDDRDRLFVLLHEAFHHVLGHLVAIPAWLRRPGMREVANVAADILVNRAVYRRFFPGGVPLLARLYDPSSPIAALLVPPEGDRQESGSLLATRLKRAGWPPETAVLAGFVYRAGWFDSIPFETLAERVRSLVSRLGRTVAIRFLGDHRPRRERTEGLPWDADGDGPPGAGRGGDLEEDELPEPVEPTLSPDLVLAVRLALTEDPNHPLRRLAHTPVTSPVFAPGRLDWPSLALGYWPSLFHGSRYDRADDELRAHVYVDVSGSFDPFASRVYGLLLALGDEVGSPVHLFSNAVSDVTLNELARGLRRSTGGTDFDCVFGHALDHRYRRILVLTDGIGDLDAGLAEAFEAAGSSLFLVLFGPSVALARTCSCLPGMARGVWEMG